MAALGAALGEGMTDERGMTRRSVLGALGALGVAAATGALALPDRATAQALGMQETVDAGLKRVFGGRPFKDGSGIIKLDIPLIAENGSVVPVSVEASSPMTPANYVKNIYIVADKNRIPIVTRVALAPEAGQAYVGANIRLGETGDVRAIVEQSDGTLLQTKREVKVTVGGCGG
jgi:sulfur-oxidizing protein SoxY